MKPTRVHQVATILQYRGVDIRAKGGLGFVIQCTPYGNIVIDRCGGNWRIDSPELADIVMTSKSIMACITFARLQGWVK